MQFLFNQGGTMLLRKTIQSKLKAGLATTVAAGLIIFVATSAQAKGGHNEHHHDTSAQHQHTGAKAVHREHHTSHSKHHTSHRKHHHHKTKVTGPVHGTGSSHNPVATPTGTPPAGTTIVRDHRGGSGDPVTRDHRGSGNTTVTGPVHGAGSSHNPVVTPTSTTIVRDHRDGGGDPVTRDHRDDKNPDVREHRTISGRRPGTYKAPDVRDHRQGYVPTPRQ